MELKERLQDVLTYSNLSVRALAIRCNLKQQTLDKHIKGIAEPSANTLMAICAAFPEISTDWMLLGKGSMLRSESKDTERLNKLVDTIATLQDTINIQKETITTLTERLKQIKA